MRARHSTLEQFIANEVEYESSTERMVIRQRMHPDTARAWREFAAQVIEHPRPPSTSNQIDGCATVCTELSADRILTEASRRADADSRPAAAVAGRLSKYR